MAAQIFFQASWYAMADYLNILQITSASSAKNVVRKETREILGIQLAQTVIDVIDVSRTRACNTTRLSQVFVMFTLFW